ncbi:MAG TPA: hypothetical protein VNB54_13895, partial [Alphaproteobacteria bacterium]|nr:hypothetical protein [Alphaproteobacteria bacterium]
QHKKPVVVVPQEPPATAAAPQPSPPTPEPAAQAADQPLVPVPTPTPAEQPKTTETPRPKHGRHAAAKKPSPSVGGEVAKSTPPKKTVVPADKTDSTTAMGQISPGPTPADAAHSQTSTDQLLQSAENNLNSITRQLSKEEEAMRTQIKEFIEQSHNATKQNDPARAHNLAVKARLLSDDLVKQR